MNHRRLRSRLLAAGTISVAVMTAALTLGVSAASAGSGPYSVTTGVTPRWNIGHIESIRNAGSDTTFFLTQTLATYFEQAGLYGCNLDSGASPNYSTCVNAPGDLSATTDTVDNYDHIEVTTGLGKIGSGDGQKQLCGAETSYFGEPDYARSSKPPSSSNGCSDLVGLGFAKDGVPAVDFPGAEGPGTPVGTTAQGYNVDACTAVNPFASSLGSACHSTTDHIVGPVAAGWLPGDAVNCDQGTTASPNPLNTASNPRVGILADSCSGVPFESEDNNSGPAPSTAWNIYCNTGGPGGGQITDWGQLTNLTGTEVPGQGTAIGVPITIGGVNTGSGTTFTFAQFVNSSQSSGACTGNSPDANSYLGPNPSNTAENENNLLENNAAQFGPFAELDYPSSDLTQTADQAALIATTLYFESNGVYNSNIHSRIVVLSGGVSYAANKMLENEVVPTTTQSGTLMGNTYPTARTLYNIYRTSTVRASTADFLDWVCDGNNLFTKGTDLYTGKNYDNEVTTAINTTYGFIRLTDSTAAPNNSCQMITAVAFPNS